MAFFGSWNTVEVEALLEQGQDINEKKDKNTKLAMAIIKCDTEMINLLLRRGAVFEPKISAYHVARSIEVARTLHEHGVDLRDVLGEAIRGFRLEGMVKYLLDIGQSFTGEDFIAAIGKLKNLEVVKTMLVRGADVNFHPLNKTITPLCEAATLKSTEILQHLLQQQGVNKDNISRALSYSWYIDSAKLLLEHGADMEYEDELGNTALMDFSFCEDPKDACETECVRVPLTEFLLSRGANINHQNLKGENALMQAIRFGCCKMAEFLISRGAKIAQQNQKGQTALHRAVVHKRLKMLNVLLAHASHADLEVPDNLGQTPLLLAFAKRRMKMIIPLVDKGANIAHLDHQGNNALMLLRG